MIDLHFHSTCSGDGKLSPEEWAEKIIRSNLSFCALTDHDSVDGLEKVSKKLKPKGIQFISGVELSAVYKSQEIHILAYDFDLAAAKKIITERNRLVREQKQGELRQAIYLFKKEGFKVSSGLKLDNKRPVGLVVALDVYYNNDNQKILIKKHGHLLNHDEFYSYYQAKGRPCFVPKSGVDVSWIINKFGSLTEDIVLAHPFVPVSYLVKPLKMEDIINLIGLGIKGVEVYHNRTSEKDVNLLEKLVVDNNLLYTGGSDSHGKEGDTPLGYYNEQKKIPDFKLSRLSCQTK